MMGTPARNGWRLRRPRPAMRMMTVGLCAAALALPGTAALAQDGTHGTSLVVATPQEPPNWDFTVGSATALNAVLFLNVLEPLLEEMEDGSYQPLLAESYKVSEDGLTYTFELAEATFHDGSDFTADDMLYSFEVYAESPRPAITGALEAVDDIEKIDDHTVEVTLSQPSQSFLDGMAGLAGIMIPEDSLEDQAQNPVGTGPFTFADWRPGVEVTLERYTDYHGELPYFEDVEMRFIGDETAAINALLAGDIDLINILVGDGMERVDSVAERDGFQVFQTPSNQLNYLAFSSKSDKFDDIRVRQAIAHAIDREAIAIGAYAGLAEPTCVFVAPRNLPWSDDYCPYAYDPAKAQELLAEVGATDLSVEMKYYNISDGPPVTELVTQYLAQVGITVEGANRELAAYLDEVLGTEPNFEMTTLTGPQTIESFLCPGWFIETCWPEFDALWQQADRALSREEAVDLRTQAVHLFTDEAYVIPTVTWIDNTLANADLEGWKSYRVLAEADLRNLRWAQD